MVKVVKLYHHRKTEPHFYRLDKVGESGFRFAGHLLVSYPLESPEFKMLSKWIDPATVRVEWIKDFNFREFKHD